MKRIPPMWRFTLAILACLGIAFVHAVLVYGVFELKGIAIPISILVMLICMKVAFKSIIGK